MRRLLLAPMALLLGGAPPPTAFLPDPAHWCGDPIDTGATAMLLPGYGAGGFPIETKSAAAQAYFNNGMQLGHAFAHKASIEAFAEARRLDPQCAMCAWGEAWASGPTINYGIEPEDRKKARRHRRQRGETGSKRPRQRTRADRRAEAALRRRQGQ